MFHPPYSMGVIAGSRRPQGNVTALLHFDGSFADSSPAARTFTNNGSLTTQTTTKKWGTHALQFNGAGWLTTPDAPEFDFGNSLFSLDCQLYIPSGTSWATDNTIWAKWGAAGNVSLLVGINSTGRLYMLDSVDGTNITITTLSATALPTDVFFHLAFWRSAGGNFQAAVDGVLASNFRSGVTLFNSSAAFSIGGVAAGGAYMPSGVVMDEFRAVFGSSEYNASNFTPPAGPYA